MKLSAIFLALPKQLSSGAQPRLQGLFVLLALFLSIFGIHLTSSIAFNIANFFQICSTLAGFEELDGGFEPILKRRNLLNNNNTSFMVD